MRLTEIEVSPAVLCPCSTSSEVHCACHLKVMTNHFLRCSKTNARVGRVQEEYIVKWLCSDKELQPVNQFDKNPSLDMLLTLGEPEQVSTGFKRFGTLLLKDATGTQVDNIEAKFPGVVKDINTQILQSWLQGRGLPQTWESLLDTLRMCDLNTLADQIEASLNTQ